MNRAWRFGALVLLFGTSCLFETTAPKPRPGSGDSDVNPDAAIVTGLVQIYDRQDRDVTPGREWYLSVTWYRADTNRDGQLEVLSRTITRSGLDGVYRIEYESPLVVRVEVAPRMCVVDFEAMECCLGNPPCNGTPCAIWLPAVGVNVHQGERLQRNLTVRCDFVPFREARAGELPTD